MLTKLDKRYIYKYDESAIKTTLEQMLNDNVIITTDKGWSSYKVCPTCTAKVEIIYSDPYGGNTKETINHINDFNKPYKVNK